MKREVSIRDAEVEFKSLEISTDANPANGPTVIFDTDVLEKYAI